MTFLLPWSPGSTDANSKTSGIARNELPEVAPKQYKELILIIQAILSKLSKQPTDEKKNEKDASSELLIKILEENFKTILIRNITEVKTTISEKDFDELSADDLIVKVIENLASKIPPSLYEDESYEKKAEDIMKVFFPNGKDSFVVPPEATWLVKLNAYSQVSGTLADFLKSILSRKESLKKDYENYKKVISSLKGGGNFIELISAMTSRFSNLLQYVVSSNEDDGLVGDETQKSNLLLSKLSKKIVEKLQDNDKGGALLGNTLGFLGQYSNQILMYMFARASHNTSGNKHIITAILEKLFSMILDFGEKNKLELNIAFEKYKNEVAQIKTSGALDQNEKIKAAEMQFKKKLEKLVESITVELGVDAEGLKKVLPNGFDSENALSRATKSFGAISSYFESKSLLTTMIENNLGKEALSPAIQASMALKSFFSNFAFEVYRDVITPQDIESDAFKGSVLQYDATMKVIDELISGTMPFANIALTDPNSELGKVILKLVNDMFLGNDGKGELGVQSDFFYTPIAEFASSDIMPKLESFFHGYCRTAFTQIFYRLAQSNPDARPGQKLDLFKLAIPHAIKICTDNVDGEQFNKDYIQWGQLVENSQEKRQLYAKLVRSFKPAAKVLINATGMIPVPDMMRNGVKKSFEESILPELLFKMYADLWKKPTAQLEAKEVTAVKKMVAANTLKLGHSLSEICPLLASSTNHLFLLFHLSNAEETFFGSKMSDLVSVQNPTMKKVWNKFQYLFSHLTQQCIEHLALSYHGEPKDADILTKAFLELRSIFERNKVDAALEVQILHYSEKTRKIKKIDQQLILLKKQAADLIPLLKEGYIEQLQHDQDKLKSEGKKVEDIVRDKELYLQFSENSGGPGDEFETLFMEASELEKNIKALKDQIILQSKSSAFTHEQREALNIEQKQKTDELALIRKRLDVLMGHDEITYFNRMHYAALMNEIDKLTGQRSNEFVILHKKDGLFIDSLKQEQVQNSSILETVKRLMTAKDYDAQVKSDLDKYSNFLYNETVKMERLLKEPDIEPSGRQKLEEEIIENSRIIELVEAESIVFRSNLVELSEVLRKKHRRIHFDLEQPTLVEYIEEYEAQLKDVKSEAVKPFDEGTSAQTFLLHAGRCVDLIKKQETEYKTEIDFLQDWIIQRKHELTAMQEKNEISLEEQKQYEQDSMRLMYRVQELERRLYRVKRNPALEKVVKLNLTSAAQLNQQSLEQGWKTIKEMLKSFTKESKSYLENTFPLQSEYEDICSKFRPLSHELMSAMGYEDPEKLPLPFIQNLCWYPVVDTFLPTFLLQLYESAWIKTPEVVEAQHNALEGSVSESPLFATEQIADIAIQQIRETLKKNPGKQAETLAGVLKEAELEAIDKNWVENFFKIIAGDEFLWTLAGKFLNGRLEYVITHLSEGRKGNEAISYVIKTLISSFKNHIKDKQKEIDDVLDIYEKMTEIESKNKYKERMSAELFSGFVDEIFKKTGLDNPVDACGLAFGADVLVKLVKNKFKLGCFDYCLKAKTNHREFSNAGKDFLQKIEKADRTLSPQQVYDVKDLYDSLFGLIGDKVNNAIIHLLKGAKAPEASVKDKILESTPATFNERWKQEKEGEWVPKNSENDIILYKKEDAKKPEDCKTVTVSGVKEITTLAKYQAISKHNCSKLADSLLDSIKKTSKEHNIILTKEFESWFKKSLEVVLEDEEVMKLISNIPDVIKGFLFKKMTQLTTKPVKINGTEKILKPKEVPGYVVKSLFSVFQKYGPQLKETIAKVLKEIKYDYRLNGSIDKEILESLGNDNKFNEIKVCFVNDLLSVFFFNPNEDLPSIPLVKEMWEGAGISLLQDSIVRSYLNVCKIELSSETQKLELDEILTKDPEQEKTKNNIHGAMSYLSEKLQGFALKTTGLKDPENKITVASFSRDMAAKAIKQLLESLKRKESPGSKILEIWLGDFIKDTTQDEQIKKIIEDIPLLVETVINKKLVQLAENGANSSQIPGHDILSKVALIFLDAIATSKEKLSQARAEALRDNPNISNDDMIEKLRKTSLNIITELFKELKFKPGSDLPAVFIEDIWESFGKSALADELSSFYLKTVDFFERKNLQVLNRLLKAETTEPSKVIRQLETTLSRSPMKSPVKLTQSNVLTGSFRWDPIMDSPTTTASTIALSLTGSMNTSAMSSSLLSSTLNTPVEIVLSEETKQLNNFVGALGDIVSNQVKKMLNLTPGSEKSPRDFANESIGEILKSMSIDSKELSPTLLQFGVDSIEKIATSEQLGKIINDIPEIIKAIVLNKLARLGKRKDMPIQPKRGESPLKYLPANLSVLILNAINTHRSDLKGVMGIHTAEITELQKSYEAKVKEIKNTWKQNKSTLPKEEIGKAKQETKKQLKELEEKLAANRKKIDDDLVTLLSKSQDPTKKPIFVKIVEGILGKNALDLDLAQDLPWPYVDKLWDSLGKSIVAEIFAKNYVEMSRIDASKEIHKMHLDERYKTSKVILGHTKIVKKAKDFARFASKLMKNTMIFNSESGVEAAMGFMIKQLKTSGNSGGEAADYIEANKNALAAWFAKSNIELLAKSKSIGVEGALFSAAEDEIESVLLELFDNFTGSLEDIDAKDPKFSYNLSLDLIKIFTEHLQAVNEVTKAEGKRYMYEVEPEVMEKQLGDKGKLHPDMPKPQLLKDIADLKKEIQNRECEVQVLENLSSDELEQKINELNQAKEKLAALVNERDAAFKKGTYAKLIRFVLTLCQWNKPEDLPGPSPEAKKQLWDLLNGELGTEMVSSLCGNLLNPDTLNAYILNLLKSVNTKVEEFCALRELPKTNDKTEEETPEQQANQLQCLEWLKAMAGAFPGTMVGNIMNLASKFNVTGRQLEAIIRQALHEQPISLLIEQAIINGADHLPEILDSQQKINVAARKAAKNIEEAPENIRAESVKAGRNVLEAIFHWIKLKWKKMQESIDRWIKDNIGSAALWIKNELDAIFRLIFFTLIGNVLKIIFYLPFKYFWKLCTEKAVERSAEINRKVWTETFINANLALQGVDAIIDRMEARMKRKKQEKEDSNQVA